MFRACRIASCILFSILFLVSCQTAEKKESEQKILSYTEEANLSNKLTVNLEKTYGLWKEPGIEKALENIVKALTSSEESAKKLEPVSVTLLATNEIIAAPGFLNRIYLSKGALLSSRYENELSYVIAQQLNFLLEEAVKKNYLSLQGQSFGQNLVIMPTNINAGKDPLTGGWFEKGGLFDFGENAYLNAEREAIRYIYQAKFDPRGAIEFVKRLRMLQKTDLRTKTLLQILPNTDEQLETARSEVAKLLPLRDPVVKSKNFEEISSFLKKAKK